MTRLIVVMGVSGSGKSTIGRILADELGVGFVDADDLHSSANVERMAAGIPLTDDDRWPWLRAVGEVLAEAQDKGLVVACSALRRTYRDMIRSQAPATLFVQLDGSRELLAERLGDRSGHFMPPALLASQLATLEPLAADEAGMIVGIDAEPAEIVTAIVTAL